VTSASDSPHRLVPRLKAQALIAIAENDDAREPDAKNALRDAFARAHLAAEIEVYPAAHGWCPPDSPVYDAKQAERAWTRLLALLTRAIG
jgi:carboxymethylenebutenolidase